MNIETNEVKIYFNDGLLRANTNNALRVLENAGSFYVTLEFIDPYTNRLVIEPIVFYPKPVQCYNIGGVGSFGFLAQYKGIMIRIPADMSTWHQAQKQNIPNMVFKQPTTILVKGEPKEVEIEFEIIGAAIRIDAHIDKRHPIQLHKRMTQTLELARLNKARLQKKTTNVSGDQLNKIFFRIDELRALSKSIATYLSAT